MVTGGVPRTAVGRRGGRASGEGEGSINFGPGWPGLESLLLPLLAQ